MHPLDGLRSHMTCAVPASGFMPSVSGASAIETSAKPSPSMSEGHTEFGASTLECEITDDCHPPTARCSCTTTSWLSKPQLTTSRSPSPVMMSAIATEYAPATLAISVVSHAPEPSLTWTNTFDVLYATLAKSTSPSPSRSLAAISNAPPTWSDTTCSIHSSGSLFSYHTTELRKSTAAAMSTSPSPSTSTATTELAPDAVSET
mmetsp:Transcript_22825/g.71510  ORF Transcript_22825/g.71510 Transcript_22825/m.71510 type:complete len:204 (-) Transcript_22825:11693-12304(-)